jgi:hypothetical protein
LADIESALLALVSCTALDSPAPSGETGPTLADSLFDCDVRGIQSRALNSQSGPEGVQWADNAPAYKARKGGLPVSILTGEMMSDEQLSGVREIGPDEAVMTYGKDDWNRQKAEWFEYGRQNQPARPMYDSDTSDDDDKAEIVNRKIQETIDKLGG